MRIAIHNKIIYAYPNIVVIIVVIFCVYDGIGFKGCSGDSRPSHNRGFFTSNNKIKFNLCLNLLYKVNHDLNKTDRSWIVS